MVTCFKELKHRGVKEKSIYASPAPTVEDPDEKPGQHQVTLEPRTVICNKIAARSAAIDW